jgi:hypothetical protein
VCKEWERESFSPTLLVKVEVVILKYESHFHSLKSNTRRRKQVHTRSLNYMLEPEIVMIYILVLF